MAKKTKRDEWIQVEEAPIDGVHIPIGAERVGGLFGHYEEKILKIVVFVNRRTGEVKIFSKNKAKQIGIDNLELD